MTDNIIISEVHSGKDLKAFIKFPNILYKKNEYFVPALSAQEKKLLSRKKNPAFEYCKARYWLARKNGKVAGRIAAVYNPLHFEAWNRNLMRFGWFDFIDDKNVSDLLLKEVEKWALELECEGVHGPFGFTDLDRKGILIEGFDELGSYPTLYNFPYYRDHLEKPGYGKEVDWVEYEITVPDEVPEKVKRVNQLVLKRSGLQFYVARSLKELRNYSARAFSLMNESYSHVYGYTELSPAQIEFYSRDYFRYVSRRFTKLVMNEKKELIGFALTRPSMTKVLQKTNGKIKLWHLFRMAKLWRRNNHLIMYFIAVRRDFMNKGVAAIVLSEITTACIEAGIKTAETSAEIETDTALRGMWKNYENRIHKVRRAFIKLFS